MTIKQLLVSHRSFMHEFNRAVVRRRANIKKVMANQLKARKVMRNPHNSASKKSVSLKHKLYNTVYRSVMNKACNSKCARYHQDKNGWWVGPSRAMKRRCRA